MRVWLPAYLPVCLPACLPVHPSFTFCRRSRARVGAAVSALICTNRGKTAGRRANIWRRRGILKRQKSKESLRSVFIAGAARRK
jgi:hypothetical protein